MKEFGTITLDFLNGIASSFFLFVLTLLISIPLGLLMCVCTMSKFKPLSWLTQGIVLVLRGTPLLLQIFVIFYVPGLLWGFKWPTLNTGWNWFDTTFSMRFIAALVAFGINYSAYFSEIFRGGLLSIPKGQFEAGAVLGMSKKEVFKKVILLQMVKRIVPPMGNEIITLVKDTSLANVIGVAELMHRAYDILNKGLVWPIFYAGAFYFIFNAVITYLLKITERKLEYIKV